MAAWVDLTGRRFGRITVLGFKERKNKHTYWFCLCDCGTEFVSIGNNLCRGKSKSCGCLRKEMVSEKYKTHGDSTERLCRIWYSIRRRIFNTHDPRYKDYGGRGIRLCDRWLKYENFKADMYSSYIEHVQKFGEWETTIERKDVDGDYCPDNCTWATREEQGKNTRRTVRLEYRGHVYSIAELAQEFNINPRTLKHRLRRGWTVEQAISIPINFRLKNATSN